MGRVILHMDANSFYVSVECLYRPALRDKPVSVCGDPEARHGIVLAKNYEAKAYGIITGEPVVMPQVQAASHSAGQTRLVNSG